MSVLLAIHKKGDPNVMANFRMIFVRVQLGLLQETLLCARLAPPVREYIWPGQSGYVRGVDDPHTFLHELVALRKPLGLVLVTLLGDHVNAFPRSWRDDLLLLMSDGAGVRAGALALFAGMLSPETIHVWLDGVSKCNVSTGLPEGSTIGMTVYVLFPDAPS